MLRKFFIVGFSLPVFCFHLQGFAASDSLAAGEEEHGVSDTRLIVGGLVGTTLGLGLGHAINGTYKEMGWVFTLGEAVTGGALIGSFAWGRSYGGDSYGKGPYYLLIFSLLGFGGFRVWEMIDVWAHPYAHDDFRSSMEKDRSRLGRQNTADVESKEVPIEKYKLCLVPFGSSGLGVNVRMVW